MKPRYGLFLSALTLVATHSQAEEVKLTCTNSSGERHLTVNEVARTVTMENSTPVSATFSETTVTWETTFISQMQGKMSHDDTWTLSRDTGKLDMTGIRFHGRSGPGNPNMSESEESQCAVTHKMF